MSTKRILSLVLALVMVLGTFGTVFAAPTASDKLEFLMDNGILKEGKVDQLLKRSDSAVLLSRLYGKEEEAKDFPASELFNDVEDAFYEGYIAWGVNEELLKGKENGKFDPNGPLTAQQFSTMLLRALRFEENGKDIFDKAYEVAGKEGILEDVDVEEKETVTRADMAAMTYNALSVVVKGTGKTLAETLGIKMPAPDKATELTAKVRDTENLKEVVIELSNSELVNADKLENVNNYKVMLGNQSLLIERVDVVGDDVRLTLADGNVFLAGRQYTLRVRSVDKAINKEYKFVAKDSTLPAVEEVVVLGEYGIKLVMSEPIDVYEYVRGRSFEVNGKNIAMDVESYGRSVILTPYYNETFPEGASTLSVTGLADFAGFRTARQEFDIEMVEHNEAPEVVDLLLKDSRTVVAVFDTDVYIDSVAGYSGTRNPGNISYLSGRHPVYAKPNTANDYGAKKIDTNKVEYVFADEFLRTRTEFTIEGVENHSGVEMAKFVGYAREVLDNVEPEIISQELLTAGKTNGNATLRLYFDKDIDSVGSVASHFRIYAREVLQRNELTLADHVTDVDYAYANRRDIIDVELTGLVRWTVAGEMEYILEVNNFEYRGIRMLRDFRDFRYATTSDFVVDADGVRVMYSNVTDSTEIRISFNKAVDRVLAEDVKNYLFEGNGPTKDVKDLGGSIITERNGYEVVIRLPGFNPANYRYMRILDTIKTTSGQRLQSVFAYDFVNGYLENNNYTVSYDSVNGVYDVTAKAGVTDITLTSQHRGTFIINSHLNTLTTNVPNGHIVIPNGVTVNKVIVKEIAANSIDIQGTVHELVAATEDVFRILGNFDGLKITSEVKNAKVKVVLTDGTVKDLTLVKDKPVVLDENGVAEEVEVKVEVVTAKVYDKTYTDVEFKVTNVVGEQETPAKDILKSDVKAYLVEMGKEAKALIVETFKATESGYEIRVKGLAKDKNVVVEVKTVKSDAEIVSE